MEAMKLDDEKMVILTFGNGDDAVEVKVKPRLTLAEKASFVKDVSNMVFIEGENGEFDYAPEFLSFAIGFALITYFTNITLPSSTESVNEFLETSDIVSRIIKAVPNLRADEVIRDAKEYVAFRRSQIDKKTKFDTLIAVASDIIGSISGKLDSMNVGDVMGFITENMPELKGEIEQLVKSQSAPFAE
jgi:hypothetical protein